jgi:hypothetical protein
MTLTANRVQAAKAEDAAFRVRELAAEIQQLRNNPATAGTGQLHSSEISRRVEEAAGAIGLESEHILRISPESPRRIGDSDYLERPTQVSLRRATLQQLVRLIHALVSADPSLRVGGMRLSAPRDENDPLVWDAELMFMQIIYSPVRNDETRIAQRRMK